MITPKHMKPLRLHLTNGKEHGGRIKAHKICYCGGSYDTFGGEYQHSVYTLFALQSGLFRPIDKKALCPDCMNNPDLAIDLLAELDEL